MIQQLEKQDIIGIVEKEVAQAKKEIIATMLLHEERNKPLPHSYFQLLQKKVEEGIILRRLGFGAKEDYNAIKKRTDIDSSRYKFKYIKGVSGYQRLICIDDKVVFFAVNNNFFISRFKPFIKAFKAYFDNEFKKGE